MRPEKRIAVMLAAAVILLLAVTAPAAPSSAEPFITLDAAHRVRDAGQCAPDGEVMRDMGVPNIGGGSGVEFPHNNCWAEWEVDLDEDVPFMVLVSGTPTGGHSQVLECVQWTVRLNGDTHGKTPQHCGDKGIGFLTPLPVLADPTNLQLPGPIPAGQHTIRVTNQIVVGPSYANSYIQHIILGPNLPPLPIPVVPPIVECIDGAGPIVLDATPSVDLDGDEMDLAWRAGALPLEPTGDGLASGLFPIGLTMVDITAADPYFSASRPVRVDVRDTLPPTAEITRPQPGHIYLGDEDHGTRVWSGQDPIVLGPVTVRASAADLCGLASVTFKARDISLVLTAPPFEFTLPPAGLIPQETLIKMEARDDKGRMTYRQIRVMQVGIDPLDPDGDGDGLDDVDEVLVHLTNPLDPDTDADGLTDGEEVLAYGTSPVEPDTDGDVLTDGEEVLLLHTDPLDPDTDADRLWDGDEIQLYGTDALDPDTDADGLLDGDEILHNCDPFDADTDGDLFNDATEAAGGSSCTNAFSIPGPLGPITLTDATEGWEPPVTDGMKPLL